MVRATFRRHPFAGFDAAGHTGTPNLGLLLGWLVGLACGSMVLTWMYAAAAVTSTVVMVAAVVLATRLLAAGAGRRLVLRETS